MKVRENLEELADILKHVRNPLEAVRALKSPAAQKRHVLNVDGAPSSVEDAAALAEQLKDLTRKLEAELLGEQGRGMDYARLKGSDLFARLCETARALRGVRPEDLPTDAERLAFFINLYNVLMFHGVLALEIRHSVMEKPWFFAGVAYEVGGLSMTPDEIENGVLRRNGNNPATGKPQLPDSDPRLAFSPSTVDPRIHVALVCAARSCPPIRFYQADAIEAQLEMAARAFVGADVDVDDTARTITLSIIFKHYAVDFGGREGLREFFARAPRRRASGAARASLFGRLRVGFSALRLDAQPGLAPPRSPTLRVGDPDRGDRRNPGRCCV